MDHIKKTVEDLKTYYKAMNRMKELGICSEWKAIIYLQREIDQYRYKIRSMEESLRFNEDVKKNTHTANLFECMPKDMVDRITSMYIDSDGNANVMFGTNEDHRSVTIKGSLESLKECMGKFKDDTVFSRFEEKE